MLCIYNLQDLFSVLPSVYSLRFEVRVRLNLKKNNGFTFCSIKMFQSLFHPSINTLKMRRLDTTRHSSMSTFDDTLSFDDGSQCATHATCPFDSEFNRAQVHSFLQEARRSTAQDGSPEPDLSMVSKLDGLTYCKITRLARRWRRARSAECLSRHRRASGRSSPAASIPHWRSHGGTR